MVAAAGTERRSRFVAGEALMLPPLHQLADVARVGQPQERSRREVRYDTEDGALHRRGFGISRITDDDGTRWERHSPYGVPAVRAGAEGQAPPELVDDVQGMVRGRVLVPTQTIATRYLDYELLDGGNAVIGCVTDESSRTAAAEPDAPGRNRRIWALHSLSEELTEKVEAMFLAAGAVPESTEAGEGPAADNASPDAASLDTESPVADLLLAYLRLQFEELLRQEPRVRHADADGIHKMRVATRRLRSALSSYRSTLEPEPARSLRGELRWLAQVLGKARDAQVMRLRLQRLICDEPKDLVMGPVAAHVDEELLHDYRQAFARIGEAMHSLRYFRALDGLETLIDTPPWTGTAGNPAGETAAGIIRRDRKRLRRRVRAARGVPEGEREEALHEARKDAKRLRYAAEVWEPIQPGNAKVMVDAAEHLQKVLGEHQDSVVTQSYLRRMGATAAAAGENGFTYGRLHALEQGHAAAARKRFVQVWKGFPSSS